jgi:hypothetical protein
LKGGKTFLMKEEFNEKEFEAPALPVSVSKKPSQSSFTEDQITWN